MSCWRICFFSEMFLLVGVELLRFLCGDGVPGEWQKILDGICLTDFAYNALK